MHFYAYVGMYGDLWVLCRFFFASSGDAGPLWRCRCMHEERFVWEIMRYTVCPDSGCRCLIDLLNYVKYYNILQRDFGQGCL